MSHLPNTLLAACAWSPRPDDAVRCAAEADALDETEALLGWSSPEQDADRNAKPRPLLAAAHDRCAAGIAQMEKALSGRRPRVGQVGAAATGKAGRMAPRPMHPYRIPMVDFARAMHEADPGFAARVREYESRFGQADPDALAVLAQASYYCWFAWDYAPDFLHACRAIGAGVPTSLRLCGQVSPRRWVQLNTYLIGVQRWLGDTRPVPAGVDGNRVSWITEWLGPRESGKECLVALFLHRLARELRGVGLSVLAGPGHREEADYEDFAAWYPEAASDDAAEGLVRQARHALGASARTDDLLAGLTKPTQPPCMHRYTRYLDIRLASIGVLAWRGRVPPDNEEPKHRAAAWLDDAAAQVRSWLEGLPPAGATGEAIHRALGAPTDRSQYIARACLLPPKDDLGTAFFDWLSARAEAGS